MILALGHPAHYQPHYLLGPSLALMLSSSAPAAEPITPDPRFTLRGLDRDETLAALEGYDGIRTLWGIDRDETLYPLEAR